MPMRESDCGLVAVSDRHLVQCVAMRDVTKTLTQDPPPVLLGKAKEPWGLHFAYCGSDLGWEWEWKWEGRGHARSCRAGALEAGSL